MSFFESYSVSKHKSSKKLYISFAKHVGNLLVAKSGATNVGHTTFNNTCVHVNTQSNIQSV